MADAAAGSVAPKGSKEEDRDALAADSPAADIVGDAVKQKTPRYGDGDEEQPPLNNGASSALLDFSDVERDQKRSSSSRDVSTPPPAQASPARRSRGEGKAQLAPTGATQSAAHLPRADKEAHKTFTELKGNMYQDNKIGRSRGYKKEAMTCECRPSRGLEDNELPCGEDSDCINRLTQVECKGADCTCGPRCANQRFQRREYADVEVIQTEKKGFGLRAASDIHADDFVYEYIGEVVEQKEFMDRMQRYREEHIRHFYFMMLQREEFLDATKKGGVARFINHSCNPNCYVSKWHVGKHMRMGIFAKRDIQHGEELTFNYNVDRYGNDAQPCYCGEPNCVGSIGGKTQTDIGGMDQLFLDALGISDEVDRLEARGTRKTKSRHLDEDFNPTLRPLHEDDDVAKVMTAVRQAASNRSILHKLLSRIHMTQDTAVQRSLVRLHGFILVSGILDEWQDDKEIVLLAMGSLARWPLVARNKVVDSGVDKQVHDLAGSEDAEINSLAKDLLSAWDALEMSYRIARKDVAASGTTSFSLEHRRVDDADYDVVQPSLEEASAPNAVFSRLDTLAPRPLGTVQTPKPVSGAPTRSFRDTQRNTPPVPTPLKRPLQPTVSIEEIIRRANEAEAEKRRLAEEAAVAARAAALAAEEAASKDKTTVSSDVSKRRGNGKHVSSLSGKRRRVGEKPSSSSSHSGSSNIEGAERRLKKLVGDVVVRCMSEHKGELDRDVFKKHARELTTIICEKEKKNPKMWPPPRDGRSAYLADGLSRDKKDKVKAFASDYVTKLIAHRRSKKGKSLHRGTNGISGKSEVGANPSATPGSMASQTTGTPHDAAREDEDEDEDGQSSSSHLSDDGGKQGYEAEQSLTSVSPATSGAPGLRNL